jgi:hypothetical protein
MSDFKTMYLSLKPTGAFFFGGENTFESRGKVNYLVRSNPFPQQTGILGLLRHLLLDINGMLDSPGARQGSGSLIKEYRSE